MQETEDKPRPPSPAPCSEEEGMVVDQAPAGSLPAADPVEAFSSFAPEGFKFQAPTGLSSFKLEPLTPRSADAFLTPRSVLFSLFCLSILLMFKTLHNF